MERGLYEGSAGTAHFGVADYSLGAVYHESRGERYEETKDGTPITMMVNIIYMLLNGMLKKSAGSLMVNTFIH